MSKFVMPRLFSSLFSSLVLLGVIYTFSCSSGAEAFSRPPKPVKHERCIPGQKLTLDVGGTLLHLERDKKSSYIINTKDGKQYSGIYLNKTNLPCDQKKLEDVVFFGNGNIRVSNRSIGSSRKTFYGRNADLIETARASESMNVLTNGIEKVDITIKGVRYTVLILPEEKYSTANQEPVVVKCKSDDKQSKTSWCRVGYFSNYGVFVGRKYLDKKFNSDTGALEMFSYLEEKLSTMTVDENSTSK